MPSAVRKVTTAKASKLKLAVREEERRAMETAFQEMESELKSQNEQLVQLRSGQAGRLSGTWVFKRWLSIWKRRLMLLGLQLLRQPPQNYLYGEPSLTGERQATPPHEWKLMMEFQLLWYLRLQNNSGWIIPAQTWKNCHRRSFRNLM